MENEEKINNESKFEEKRCDTSCFGEQGMFDAMAECCDGMSGLGDCTSIMTECMKRCKWFLLIPLVIGIFLLLLGYVLDAEVVRILWMTAIGSAILMGAFVFLMMSLRKRT